MSKPTLSHGTRKEWVYVFPEAVDLVLWPIIISLALNSVTEHHGSSSCITEHRADGRPDHPSTLLGDAKKVVASEVI